MGSFNPLVVLPECNENSLDVVCIPIMPNMPVSVIPAYLDKKTSIKIKELRFQKHKFIYNIGGEVVYRYQLITNNSPLINWKIV